MPKKDTPHQKKIREEVWKKINEKFPFPKKENLIQKPCGHEKGTACCCRAETENPRVRKFDHAFEEDEYDEESWP